MRPNTSVAIETFIENFNRQNLFTFDLADALNEVYSSAEFKDLLHALILSPAYEKQLGEEFLHADALDAVSPCRQLSSGLAMSQRKFFSLFYQLVGAFCSATGNVWQTFSERIDKDEVASKARVSDQLLKSNDQNYYEGLIDNLSESNPHAVHPTSSYRISKGYVVSSEDDKSVEAVMSMSTFTSIRITSDVLDPKNETLKKIYKHEGRCIAVIDQNVNDHYATEIKSYFDHHKIKLEKLVYRAMEVDKGIGTVEHMLGDFKRLGVTRNAPVLIVGGGVLADTAGLACALYHRNTPYIMLSTSIVAGIDAGPSPRTCCDGFGYKNLFGSYHAPVMSITDRSFFKTMRVGWLRHGVAEIIKMAVVKNIKLFEMLEDADDGLIESGFGSKIEDPEHLIHDQADRIIAAAMRSYVEAEYDNLYETHQCRPHAYGHTWSPGFEISAGLLHGHAVSIGMGFGAYLSYKKQWITSDQLHRILTLISRYDLSLWHQILDDKELVWSAQVKMEEKRGKQLAAPLPKGEIGRCGYLNDLSKKELFEALEAYKEVCQVYPRLGLGVEAHCADVGLENPATVGTNQKPQAVINKKAVGSGK